jgi:Ca2+-binding EF-hand superfamily protein
MSFSHLTFPAPWGRYRASKSELERLCGARGATWADFLRRVRERHSDLEDDDEARQAFKALDQSCNGFLSLSDVKSSLREVLPNIPSSVVEQVFFEMDSDRDGRLSYQSFRTMWRGA